MHAEKELEEYTCQSLFRIENQAFDSMFNVLVEYFKSHTLCGFKLDLLDATGSDGSVVSYASSLPINRLMIYVQSSQALEAAKEKVMSDHKCVTTLTLPVGENLFDIGIYNYRVFPSIRKMIRLIMSIKEGGVLIVYGYMLPHENLIYELLNDFGFEPDANHSSYWNEWRFSLFRRVKINNEQNKDDIFWTEMPNDWYKSMEPVKVLPDWLIAFPWSSSKIDAKWKITIYPDENVFNGFHFGAHSILNFLPNIVEEMNAQSCVLDFGCGGGILAIACKLLGVERVYGIDIDPSALAQAKKNLTLNNFSVQLKDKIDIDDRFDLILANLPGDAHIINVGHQLKCLGASGRIIAAGFDNRQQEVQYEDVLRGFSKVVFVRKDYKGNAVYFVKFDES